MIFTKTWPNNKSVSSTSPTTSGAFICSNIAAFIYKFYLSFTTFICAFLMRFVVEILFPLESVIIGYRTISTVSGILSILRISSILLSFPFTIMSGIKSQIILVGRTSSNITTSSTKLKFSRAILRLYSLCIGRLGPLRILVVQYGLDVTGRISHLQKLLSHCRILSFSCSLYVKFSDKKTVRLTQTNDKFGKFLGIN